MQRNSHPIPVRRAVGWGLILSGTIAAVACGWDPRRPFERVSPEVDKAIHELDAGQTQAAASRLTQYIRASGCDGGAMVAPAAPDAANATFDLGLTLFNLAERYGKRFGEPNPERDGGPTEEERQQAVLRGSEIDCARAILDAIVARDLSADLEARAWFLRGNLAYLDRRWDDAVRDYDHALHVTPGLPADAGDSIGRDAAWNRSLALQHKEDEEKKKDASNDAPDSADSSDGDSGTDAPKDAPPDQQQDSGEKDAPDNEPKDSGKDGDKPKDQSPDSGQDAGAQDSGTNAAPQPTSANQDDRMLDQLEQAPTWQKEEAKSRAAGRKVRGMLDK